MRNICFYFQIHQPFRFRRYRFFDIGNDHYYYDDYTNEMVLRKVANKSYLPTNALLLKLINKHKGKFKVAFSISGTAIDQFKLYAPEVLSSFKELAETGHVEFLAETYSHSLVALKDNDEFKLQVEKHVRVIQELFGQTPTIFRNSELIYSDLIGETVANMGFKAMLTEGAKHVLGWKSPNYLYCNAINPRLKVLLKNFVLSDDIAFRFSNKEWCEWPLTADKYATWLNSLDARDEVVNLFLDYETFGEHQWKETGIFDFLENLPSAVFKKSNFKFATPSEISESLQPVSAIHVPNPISWADEERDLTAWLGNEMQQEAFNKLYSLLPKIARCPDARLQKDWCYLQTSDHLYYMSTKYFSDGSVHAYFNPYETPYEAFINYMNVLSDFTLRINAAVPENNTEMELSNLAALIEQKEQKIQKLEAEIKKMRSGKTSRAVAPKTV
ncbi:MAG: glycoside hydrolase family 57 protein [Breznakibacter sp.]